MFSARAKKSIIFENQQRYVYIDGKLFPVEIRSNGHGIDGDWRKHNKDFLEYIPVKLPTDIALKLRQLMKKLNLNFSGIDLVLAENNYYFIESNPTGEWGWLSRTTGTPLEEEIAYALLRCSI